MRALLMVGWLTFGALWGAAAGCGSNSTDSKDPPSAGPQAGGAPQVEPAPADSAATLLRQMTAAYTGADHYHDRGVLRLSYVDNEIPVRDEAPLSVSWQRPGRLRIRAYQLDILCDQGRMRARVKDETTNDLDGQVMSTEVSDPLSLEDLYRDQLLFDLLNGLGGHPIQLKLLLAENSLSEFAEQPLGMLDEQPIEGRTCQRLSVGTGNDKLVLWIDKGTKVLRRLEYPTSGRQPGDAVRDMSLVADFQGATFSSAPAEDFQFQAPRDAKQVQYFVTPPQPSSTELLGRQPGSFSFTLLADGERVGQRQLLGQPAVLLWFSRHPGCEATLRQLQQVRRALPQDAVRMLAVCTEPQDQSDTQIQQQLESWEIDLPAARDLEACGRDVFRVPHLPALVLLDKEGQVQMFDVGHNPSLPEELVLALQMLERGEDVADVMISRSLNEQAVYRQDLAAAGAEGIAAEFPVAERSEPQHLQLSQQWRNDEFKQPGNVITYGEPIEEGIVLLEGLRSICVIDPTGEKVAEKILDLPAGEVVTFLRTTVVPHKESKRLLYLAGAEGGSRVFLFGQIWDRISSHPRQPLHDGILDGQLIPQADAPARLLVGYRHAGVHGVSESGERVWSDRTLDTVTSLAVVGEEVIAASPRGELVRLSLDGQVLQGPLRVPGWPIFHVFAARYQGTQGARLCGISYDALGRRVAVGLDAHWQALWTHPMPPGMFRDPVDFVTSGQLWEEDTGHWVLAAPDGSLHVISADGSLHDSFHYGELIRGLTVSPQGRLLVASDQGLVSWSLRKK